MTNKLSMNEKDLIKMQEENPTLQKLKQLKGRGLDRNIWFRTRSEEEFGTGYVEEKMMSETPVSKFWRLNL